MQWHSVAGPPELDSYIDHSVTLFTVKKSVATNPPRRHRRKLLCSKLLSEKPLECLRALLGARPRSPHLIQRTYTLPHTIKRLLPRLGSTDALDRLEQASSPSNECDLHRGDRDEPEVV